MDLNKITKCKTLKEVEKKYTLEEFENLIRDWVKNNPDEMDKIAKEIFSEIQKRVKEGKEQDQWERQTPMPWGVTFNYRN